MYGLWVPLVVEWMTPVARVVPTRLCGVCGRSRGRYLMTCQQGSPYPFEWRSPRLCPPCHRHSPSVPRTGTWKVRGHRVTWMTPGAARGPVGAAWTARQCWVVGRLHPCPSVHRTGRSHMQWNRVGNRAASTKRTPVLVRGSQGTGRPAAHCVATQVCDVEVLNVLGRQGSSL